jgi:hypothetical protein
MSKDRSRTPSKSRKLVSQFDAYDECQYVLNTEEQILRAITVRAPLADILNEISRVLDCQIGNVVSLIALPGDDAGELTAIAMKAELYGLSPFYSEGITFWDDKLLGSLEMYSSEPQCPTTDELALIGRAKWLAAIAIIRDTETGNQTKGIFPENPRLRENPQPRPAFLN